MEKLKQKKQDSFFNRNKFVMLSGACALAIMLLVFYCYDLIPFGDMTILRMDLYHQYGPLFAELYDRITSGSSLLYSWNSGLGSSFLGNFLNYLSSPLSLLVLVFGHENITEAISTLILLKAVLSACSFTYYLKSSIGKNNAATAAFGVLYAFCGYFVAYYWNVMWMDAMYLFPLVILGIEKIIKKGKPGLYCIALMLTFLTNYYMAYMVCVFSVLYFLTYYFSNYPLSKTFIPVDLTQKTSVFKKLRNSVFFCSGWKFAFYSVIAVGIVAVLMFPLIEVLSSSSATSGTAPTEYKKYFTVFDFLANHFAATEPTIRSSGSDVLPNVYCGIATLILVPLYLFCKKISTREKIAHVCLLGVLYFSFSINFLNFFWHGFHFPNDLPYRFSFMYSFVLLQMAYKTFINIRSIPATKILASGIGVIAFAVLVEKITSKNIDDISLIVTLAFAVGYTVILYLFKDKRFQTSVLAVLMLCASVSEIALSNTNKYSMNQSKTHYTEDYEAFRTLKAKLDEYDGTPFYRMELTHLRTRMDPSWYNYNGVSVFSSMAYEKVANLQKDIGMFGNYINSYTYNPQTPVYNAMFGLKYLVNNDSSDLNPEIYKELFGEDVFIAYENQYALPIAFACNENVLNWTSDCNDNPFLSQQEWFKQATGIQDSVFKKLSVNYIDYNNISEFLEEDLETGVLSFTKTDDSASASFTLELTPTETQNVYVYIESSQVDSATISGNLFSKTVDTNDGYIVDLGVCEANETIFVDIPIKSSSSSGIVEFYAYSLDLDAFKAGYEKLADGGLNITDFQDTQIVGTLTADEDEVVYTSIPYDTSWQVYVDGKRVYSDDIVKVSDGLLAFRVGAGEHTVTLRYVSAGLYVGSIVSIFTILLATLLVILQRRQVLCYKKKNTEKWYALSDQTTNLPLEEKNETDNFISEYLDLDVVVEDKKKDPPETK